MEGVFSRDIFNTYWIFYHVKSVFSRDIFNINLIYKNDRRCLLKKYFILNLILLNIYIMILKTVEDALQKTPLAKVKKAQPTGNSAERKNDRT